MKLKKMRILSFVLAVLMICNLPLTAFASTGMNMTTLQTATGSNAQAVVTEQVATDSDATSPEELATDSDATSPEELATDSNALMLMLKASDQFPESQLTVVTDKESTLATGVTQNAMTVYDKNGDQVKMWITTADMSVDTVKLFASYKDMNPTDYGMSKLTEQVASFNEKAASGDEYYQGTVVAGINASYYNMITGKPTGTFVMNGIDVTTESEGNAYGYFAVMKDGTVKIGDKGDYSEDKGNIQEAIGIYTMLIVDGEICSGLNTVQKYPRQTIGITADGDVILMTADGNQAPTSIGLTVEEQAQVMLDLGCVWAGHLDGGGSCTYAAKSEGSDEFKITNSPSDGSERSVSNGFIIVSTEEVSKEFNKVKFATDYEYVTPGTSVPVVLTGVSASGNAAEIPEEVTYVTSNGTFDGETLTVGTEYGVATITAMYNEKEAGSVTISVENPDTVSFSGSEITVPFGKTVSLEMTATLNSKPVAIKAEDFTFTFTNEAIGTMNGFEFTACEMTEDAPTSSDVEAVLIADNDVKATTKITLGRGSEVVYDFEDGTSQNVFINETPGTKYNYVWPEVEQSVVTKSTGQVHSGDYALAGYVNYGNSLESGYMKTSVYATETKVFENAVGLGTWIYIPDECVGLWARWTLKEVSGYNEDGTPIWGTSVNSNTMDTGAGGTGVVYTFDESGWHYLYADTSAYSAVGWSADGAMMQFYISDRDGSAYNYVAAENSNIPGKFQFYLDDITVDYSTAVDDREAPVFSDVTYATEGMPDAADLNGQTITTNKVTIAASVEDYKGKTNYTGIDASSIVAYVDGVEVEYTYSNNIVSVDLDSLTNGKHTIKFAANDKMGNYGYVYQYITVNVDDNQSTVKLVPADETLDRIKLGSIYNMNLVASAMEEVEEVEVVIDLDNNSVWQLAHMDVAEGFEAEYSVEKTENIATIIITRTGDNDTTGEGVLATLPVRTWELKTGYTYPNGTKAGQAAFTYAQYKTSKEFWRMSVIATVDKGVLTRVDDTVSTFTGERVFCDTEMWANYANMTATTEGAEYYNAWDGGHIHTAAAIADQSATCTKDGYANRTFCEVCNSVVEWGTTKEATGHEYGFVDNILQCTNGCGKKFTGVYEGKEYVDGVLTANGWSGDYYYVDGIKLTGVQKVIAPDSTDEFYYNFGDDGICKGKYTGLLYDNEVAAYFYSQIGVISSGWKQIEEDWYYFDSDTYMPVSEKTFTFTTNKVTYQFEQNGKLVSGVWVTMKNGTRYYYGPDYHKLVAKTGNVTWVEIDGNVYGFDGMGYRHEGICFIKESNNPRELHVFGNDGVHEGKYTGLYDGYYYSEGFVKGGLGIIKIDSDYYYISQSGKPYVGTLYVTESNANGYFPAGSYFFKEDGKMDIKQGIVNGYYYEDGVLIKGKGIIKIDNDYYYIGMQGQVYTGKTLYISAEKANGYFPAGSYFFKEDGKMDIKQGIVNGYYYEDGVLIKGKGIIKIDNDYYYIGMQGQVYTGKTLYISAEKANGYFPAGSYFFKEDGKMDIKQGIVNGFYYEDGVLIKGKGVIEVDGNYYYIGQQGQVYLGSSLYISKAKANDYLKEGVYKFASDGKIITE